MNVQLTPDALSKNYVFNSNDFLVSSAGSITSADYSNQFVALTGGIMSGALNAVEFDAPLIKITNATNTNDVNLTTANNGLDFSVDVVNAGTGDTTTTLVSHSNALSRNATFSYTGLDLGGGSLLNTANLGGRAFCRLILYTDASSNKFYQAQYWSGINVTNNSSGIPCVTRTAVGQITVSIDCAWAGISKTAPPQCITYSSGGNFNGVSGGANGLVVEEYGIRSFVSASGSVPDIINISFQFGRTSAPSSLVDINTGGYIDLYFNSFNSYVTSNASGARTVVP